MNLKEFIQKYYSDSNPKYVIATGQEIGYMLVLDKDGKEIELSLERPNNYWQDNTDLAESGTIEAHRLYFL